MSKSAGAQRSGKCRQLTVNEMPFFSTKQRLGDGDVIEEVGVDTARSEIELLERDVVQVLAGGCIAREFDVV